MAGAAPTTRAPLARDLDRQRPDLGPMWSRIWLDFVLSPEPLETRPPMVRPWVMETTESINVAFTRHDTLALFGKESRLRVRPDTPTTRLLLGYVTPPGRNVVTVAPEGEAVAEVATEVAVDHRVRYVDVSWDRPATFVDVTCSDVAQVSLVAYETGQRTPV